MIKGNKYLSLKKTTCSPGTLRFPWPLQQFGDETEHSCGSAFVNMFEFDAAVSTMFAPLWSSNLALSMVRSRLVQDWLRVIEGCFGVYLKLVEGFF